jgi:peroxiredoxin
LEEKTVYENRKFFYVIGKNLQNMAAPQLTMKDINGNDIRLSNLKGKYVLLDFWATWCAPCMAQMPFIKKLHTDFSSDKLVIIGISEDRSIDKFKSEIAKGQMNWLNVFDENNKIEHQFGINAIPTTILINKEGIITYYHSGLGKDSQEALLKLLQ